MSDVLHLIKVLGQLKLFLDSAPAVASGSCDVDGFPIDGSDLRVVGLAVSWANRDAYYIAFTKQNINSK